MALREAGNNPAPWKPGKPLVLREPAKTLGRVAAMWKFFVPIVAPLFLAACAAPLPFKIASWALDGISYLSTGKSVTDHGLSLVAQKDCALWRPVKGEKICNDPIDSGGVVVADASGTFGPGPLASVVEAVDIDERRESAAGPLPYDALASKGRSSSIGDDIAPAELNMGEEEDINELGLIAPAAQAGMLPYSTTLDGSSMIIKVSLKDILIDESKIVDEPKKNPVPVVPSARLNGGFYYVIGSFRWDSNAYDLVAKQTVFAPQIVVKEQDDGRRRYRVVIGPVPVDRRQALRRQIIDVGILDVWALRITPQAMLAARLGNSSGNT